ncbi:BamA/TamA family outer membrane protein, partial [Acinetobacter baumannii]
EGAHPELLSDADYVLLRTGLRWLDTFAGRHMLLARLDAGIILSPGFDDVPPSVRFYAGGDNSVRGYDYRSLAPRNANNEVVGGRYLLAGSL